MSTPIYKVSAPGKVILHGEHAVVYGCKAIAVSVGLTTVVTISPSTELIIKFGEVGLDTHIPEVSLNQLKAQIGENFRFDVLNASESIPVEPSITKLLEKFIDDHADLLLPCDSEMVAAHAQRAALQSFLFMYLGIFPEYKPLCVTVETELPVGAGLGSSASFAVGLAGAFLLAGGRMDKSTLDLPLVNRWAFVSEQFVHGNPSGLDNNICTFGGAILFQKNHPLQKIKCSAVRVLLVSTDIPRSTKALVAKVAKLKEDQPAVHEEIMKSVETVVDQVVENLKIHGETTPTLVAQNQKLLVQMGVSHPALDFIVDTAKKHSLSAKLTGAGGGGCAFILLPKSFSDSALKTLKNDLSSGDYKFRFWTVPLGGEGFKVL